MRASLVGRVQKSRPVTAAAVALLLASSIVAPRAQSADDLFNPDVLHDVHLRVNARDWDTLKRNYELDTNYPAVFTWNGVSVRDVAIRSRGLGSRSGVKPGLKIDFGRYRDGQRFAGLQSLVLDNHLQDPSMMRERLSMRLYQRLGWPAPREAAARVFVNDEYAGLYSLVEDIDEEFLQHHFGLSAEDIANRAYLYEYRWLFHYTFTDLGRRLERYEEIFEPKLKAHRSLAELLGPVEDMIQTVNEAGDNFVARAGEYLDLRDLMTFLAIGNYLADSDGFLGDFGINNFYIVRLDARRFERFIPWDKDNAMVFDPRDPARAINFPVLHQFPENILSRKAIEVPELRDAYFAELLRSADVSAGWLEGEINRQFDRTRDAVSADPVKPHSDDEFAGAVAHLRRFAQGRPNAVRQQVQSLR